MENYYDKNSIEYINNTLNCDMSNIYNFFEPYLINSHNILDIGFGSGRDMIYFKNKGLDVYGIDPSIEMCNNAKRIGLSNVLNITAQELSFINKFDSIWACASLLHISSKELIDVFIKCFKALKKNGIMYCSFKYGEFEGIRDNRFFNDMTIEKLSIILNKSGLKIINSIITLDVRPDNSTKWINVILKA